ncbi:MAG: methyltransferase domain-containing protein [candidate division Zixibacteria bacterium]|nr:methyltransferase domain-containing protein [candidate division Zixibacteria bacterium]
MTTVEFNEKLVLHTPALAGHDYDSVTLMMDPDAPNWIGTDRRGARLLRMLDGHRTFGEVVSLYAQENAMDVAKAWLHCHDFVKEAMRYNMVSLKPFVSPPYAGRAAVAKADRLSELWIHTNNSCNLTCAHCLVSSSPHGEAGLPTETLKRIIDEAVDAGVERFYFTGGEPFVRKDLFDLIGYVTDRADLVILTNAMLLHGTRLNRLAAMDASRLRFQVSVDGSTPKINDPIRGEGSFAGTIRGLKNLKSIGFDPTITTVVTPDNVDDVPNVTRLAGELGLSTHHLMWMHARGRATEPGGTGIVLSVERLIETAKKARAAGEEVGVTIDNYQAMENRVNGEPSVKLDLSLAGWGSLCVYADGHVYPSASFAGHGPLDMGSVLERPLKDIWLDSPIARHFREATVQQKDVCHACHLKFVCGGGDIEHSYFHSRRIEGEGRLLAWDPYCELYRHFIYEGMGKLTEDKARAKVNSGYNSPPLHHAMGEGAVVCGANGHAPRPGALRVEMLHSNCVLTYDLDISRAVVREFYGQAAEQPQTELCCPTSYDRSLTEHIPQEVLDRFYGCGSPMELGEVQPGETVIDLGSGGGIDCFIAARLVGATGKVVGVDMTDQMLQVAHENRVKVATSLGYDVVEFRKGFLEELPVEDRSVDLITSNCVINLSPDKKRVFREMWRVLNDHGRVVVSDIVTEVSVPAHLQANARLWGECLSGALTEDEFLSFLEQAGFYGLAILKKTYWKEVEGYRFYSVTVRGFKYEKKAGCVYIGQAAIYRGPFKSIMDEEGHLFPRNEAIAVCTDTAAKLQQGPYTGLFTVTDPTREIPEDFLSACCGPGGACC